MIENPAFKSLKNIVSDVYAKTTSDNFSEGMLDEYKKNVSDVISKLSDLQSGFINKGDNIGAYLCELKSLGLQSTVSLIASTSNVSTGQINVEQQASLFMSNIQNRLSKLTLPSKMDTPEISDKKRFMADAQSFYDKKTPEHFDSVNSEINDVVKSVMAGKSEYAITEDIFSCLDKYGQDFCNTVYTPLQRAGAVEFKEPAQQMKMERGLGLDGYSQDDINRIAKEFDSYAKAKGWDKTVW